MRHQRSPHSRHRSRGSRKGASRLAGGELRRDGVQCFVQRRRHKQRLPRLRQCAGAIAVRHRSAGARERSVARDLPIRSVLHAIVCSSRRDRRLCAAQRVFERRSGGGLQWWRRPAPRVQPHRVPREWERVRLIRPMQERGVHLRRNPYGRRFHDGRLLWNVHIDGLGKRVLPCRRWHRMRDRNGVRPGNMHET